MNKAEIRTSPAHAQPEHPPTMMATIDLPSVRSTGSQIASIIVKREDGKCARINLHFFSDGRKLKAEVATIGIDDDQHVRKTVNGKFQWEIDDNGDLQYPKGDERR